jgi:hypothetical protein
MLRSIQLLLCLIIRLFRSRRNLLLENIALRQQLITLKRKHTKPRLSHFDRLFWVMVRRMWSKWKDALVIVTPETVVGWYKNSEILTVLVPQQYANSRAAHTACFQATSPQFRSVPDCLAFILPIQRHGCIHVLHYGETFGFVTVELGAIFHCGSAICSHSRKGAWASPRAPIGSM